mgnify:CR=1 FL=1
MGKKTTSLAVIALVFCTAAQAATTKSREQIDLKGLEATTFEVCNYNDFPARLDIVPTQYPEGDTTKPMVSASHLVSVRPSSIGTAENPIPPVSADKDNGCQTITVRAKKGIEHAQFLYLSTSVTQVGEPDVMAANTLAVVPKAYQLVTVGVNKMTDIPELSGVIQDDGIIIKNAGKRPVMVQAVKVDGVRYQVSKLRQIFADAEAKVFMSPETITTVRNAIKSGKDVVMLNHYGDPVPIKL